MRILQLSTYPARIPRHGGQARVANIRTVLEGAGHEVRTFCVYQPEHYAGETVEDHDVAFPAKSCFRETAHELCTDLASGDFLAGDAAAFRSFAALVRSFAPDVLSLEQPWLWPAVRRLRAEHPEFAFRLVYSSQNIEAPLKREVLHNWKVANLDDIAARVETRQRAVAQAADLCIACTSADAHVLQQFGGRRVVIAGNGIVARSVDPVVMGNWAWLFGRRTFALFVGSAYPPNADGFWDLFSPSLAFLPPDCFILTVGGVSPLVFNHSAQQKWTGINQSRLVCAEPQSEEVLAALIALAGCIVLPITRGGGSNIKTAEAIYARTPVVGTTKSFRGYEHALSLPHIYRSDEPHQFRQLVLAALLNRLPPAGPEEPELRDSVLWRNTLAGLPAEFAKLASPEAVAAHAPTADISRGAVP